MSETAGAGIRAAEVVLPCPSLRASAAFFTEELGFRVESIRPADDPSEIVLSGHGTRIVLKRDAPGAPGTLRLHGGDPAGVRTAPCGTRIEVVPPSAVALPPLAPAVVVTRPEDAEWSVGRADMRYRDLIPGCQGGRFGASHIRIPEGGPVADSVHYHLVRFQIIYCHAGRVRVVYEDQGEPFELEAGDCVLQPPGIRHRVLESCAGLEVIEVSSPADHETRLDHGLELPTAQVTPERAFGGQRFVRHVAREASWEPWRYTGFEARDTGIGAATDGRGSVRVARVAAEPDETMSAVDTELLFLFVLRGTTTLLLEGRRAEALGPASSCVVPGGHAHAFSSCSPDLELLEVALPAL